MVGLLPFKSIVNCYLKSCYNVFKIYIFLYFKRHFCKSHYTCICIEVGASLKIVIIQNELFRYYRYLRGPFFPFLLRNTPVTSGFYNFVSGNNINFEGLPTGIGKLYNLVSCQLWRVLWNLRIVNFYFSSWSYCTLPRPCLNNKNTESNINEVPEINCVQTVC